MKERFEKEAEAPDAGKHVFEIAMDNYVKKQSYVSLISVSIVMRPCLLIAGVFLVMFVIFMIASMSGLADMKVTQLHDFINQTSDATQIHRAVDGAHVFFNLRENQGYKLVPLQIQETTQLNADIVYTTDTEEVDMIQLHYLQRIEKLEKYIKE